MVNNSWTATVPGRQTRDRSLRIKSTIMTFSAASLAEARSARGAVVGHARRCALDRSGQYGAVSDPQEELRAEGGDHAWRTVAQRASDQATEGGLQLFAQVPEHDWCAAGNVGVQSDTEVQLVEAAVVDPVDHLFHAGEIAISSGLSIR